MYRQACTHRTHLIKVCLSGFRHSAEHFPALIITVQKLRANVQDTWPLNNHHVLFRQAQINCTTVFLRNRLVSQDKRLLMLEISNVFMITALEELLVESSFSRRNIPSLLWCRLSTTSPGCRRAQLPPAARREQQPFNCGYWEIYR